MKYCNFRKKGNLNVVVIFYSRGQYKIRNDKALPTCSVHVIIKARGKWWILLRQPGFQCVIYSYLRWVFKCGSQSVHLNPHGRLITAYLPCLCSHPQIVYDFNTDNVVPLKDFKKYLYFKWNFLYSYIHTHYTWKGGLINAHIT